MLTIEQPLRFYTLHQIISALASISVSNKEEESHTILTDTPSKDNKLYEIRPQSLEIDEIKKTFSVTGLVVKENEFNPRFHFHLYPTHLARENRYPIKVVYDWV